MSDNKGQPVVLSRSWSREDGVTIPAGTEIWVTEEKERELREAGLVQENPTVIGEYVTGIASTGGPPEPDEEFFDVHRDNP